MSAEASSSAAADQLREVLKAHEGGLPAKAESQSSKPPAPDPLEAEATELSWYIVCCMYAVGVVICAVLGAIQVSGAYPNLEGSWLIFAPFGPCLGYAFTRHLSQRATQKKLAAGLKKTQ